MAQFARETVAAASSASAADEGPSFETALAELETIVARMEDGQLPLEESLTAYRRGAELLQRCQRQLADAERRIQILDNGTLREFDAAAGDS